MPFKLQTYRVYYFLRATEISLGICRSIVNFCFFQRNNERQFLASKYHAIAHAQSAFHGGSTVALQTCCVKFLGEEN